MRSSIIQVDFWEQAAAVWGQPLDSKQIEQEEQIQQIAVQSITSVLAILNQNETKKKIGSALDAIWDDDDEDDYI